MHIGFVCKSLDASRGGHERYVNRLLSGLIDRGYTFTVFTGDSGDPSFSPQNMEVVEVPSVRLGGALRRLTFNYFAKRLVNEHQSYLQLVFTTGKVDFGDLHRSGGGVHHTFLQRCEPWYKRMLPKNQVACRMERRLYENRSDRTIIVNSKMVKQQILDRFDTPEEAVRVIYNGIDTDRYHAPDLRTYRDEVREKHGFTDDDFVCLFTGGSWKRKGLPQLLEALHHVEDPSVKLLIVGRVREGRVRHGAERLGLRDRIELAGYTDVLERYYAAADVLAFPSRYDPAANVVIEALASGLPVVTTKTNGSHELVEEGANGYVIDRAEETEKLAAALRRVRNHDDPEQLRTNAFETGRQYTMERHVDQVEDVIRSR